MKLLRLIITLSLALGASSAWGHGFDLLLNFNNSGVPVSISSSSQEAQLDQGNSVPVPSAMNSNEFLDQFSDQNPLGANTTLPGLGAPTVPAGYDWQNTNEGGPNQVTSAVDVDPNVPTNQDTLASWQHGGSGGPYYQPSMGFTITSPLLYADGTGPAVHASTGTLLYFSDNADSNTLSDSLHATLTGNSLVNTAGWTLVDPYPPISYGDAGHEIIKNLYIASGSTQTAGEYAFSYTVTANFGSFSLTSATLVDVFALDNTGNAVGFLASNSAQDAATLALYSALTVPEPSTGVLALLGVGLAGLSRLWKRQRAE